MLPEVAVFEPLNWGLLVDYSTNCTTAAGMPASNFVCQITLLTFYCKPRHYTLRSSWSFPLNLTLLVEYSTNCATAIACLSSNFVCSITFLTCIANQRYYTPRGR
jgi:hypothetical protein